MIKRRKAAKTRSPQEDHQLNKETRDSLQNDKKEWMGKTVNELENAASKQYMRNMYLHSGRF